ncbi:MAG: DAK2 domain-containing protein [Oscillospiraceae bacterium]|nr:DAK2 domain-containing protein [Oscillospiraceae bacterium]
MIVNAAAAIENHKNEINELNVFPVPDGDTGTNLSLTMSAAERAMLPTSPKTIGEAVEVMASAMLRGARGNSGVILSLLFRGFSKRLKDLETADAQAFAHALANGVDAAYKAVMKPAEGTMLTVSRLAAGTAVSVAESEDDIEIVLERALATGYAALADTINQNPVLKKAGVVDAGGKGYLYMLDGMLRAIRGEIMEKAAAGAADSDKADFAQFHAEDITFTYCTEFMIDYTTKKNPNHLREFLDKRGDSVVVVDDDSIIKVHIHTDQPGDVLTEGLKYGSLITIKIENMREQHAQAVDAAQEPVEMKEYAIVAVCAGSGISEVFNDLGADKIITGGQTMNPSTEDILEKISSAPSEVVFVLPNNKNIIMAAQQCEKLSDKRVIVIPTKSIPQGVAALLTLDGSGDVEEMTESMTEAATRVKTALVTKAARDSVFDDMEIKNEEYLALIEDSLAAHGDDESEVFDVVAAALGEMLPEFITVFTGEDAGEAETQSLLKKIDEISNGAEVAVINGGQPVYHFIISAE